MTPTSPGPSGTAERTNGLDPDAHQQDKLAVLGHMATSIAHDLNNPLASIVTSVESVLAFWPDDPGSAPSMERGSFREDLELVAEEARRARDIIHGLLEFAREDEPRREAVSFNDVARTAVRLTRSHLQQANIEIQTESAVRDPFDRVQGDPSRLQQVAMNLIINSQQAISAGRDHGRIWIRISAGIKASVVMTIEDDGPGVPPDLHQTIFAPYYTTKSHGTGLGLAIAQRIVSDHGGTLTIEDRSEGGARFAVEMPVASRRTPRASSPTRRPRLSARTTPTVYRILLVDDEPGVLRATSRFLRRVGWEVDVAENGHTALEQMATGSYDAILSDLRMPGLNGEALYDAVRKNHPQLAQRMAFISGDTMRHDTREFLSRCGCPSLQKPYELPELLEVLDQCTNGNGAGGPRVPD